MKLKLFNISIISVMIIISLGLSSCQDQQAAAGERNLALLAVADGSMNFGGYLAGLNDRLTPTDSLPWSSSADNLIQPVLMRFQQTSCV